MRILASCVLIVLASCGGDDGGSDGGGGGVPGVAHLVHGPAVPPGAMVAEPRPAAAADGKWYVSPDQARVRIDRINFAGDTPTGADLVDCVITFDRSTPSLSSLLDCPFDIAPGTYTGMTVFVNGTFQVLLSDATNGIFTDPAAPGKLSPAAPATGAAFVDYTRPLGGTGVQQTFPTPLVVATGDTVSLAVVLDAVQTLQINSSGGGSTLAFTNLDSIPVNVFSTLAMPGIARYYTTANTAVSYNDSLVLANILRTYFAAGTDAQPVYVLDQQVAGTINTCAAGASSFGSSPADPGGRAGIDSTRTTCWALPATGGGYWAYLTLSDATTLGSSATLSCQQFAPPPPTSGMTYASGCPAITPDATASLMLVAN